MKPPKQKTDKLEIAKAQARESAEKNRNLLFGSLLIFAFLILVVLQTTDVDLIFGKIIKLPVVDVDIPSIAFCLFLSSPLAFFVHLNLLRNIEAHAVKLKAWKNANQNKPLKPADLFPFIFDFAVVDQESPLTKPTRWFSQLVIYWLGTLTLLVIFWRFTDYQNPSVTFIHMAFLLADFLIVRIMRQRILDILSNSASEEAEEEKTSQIKQWILRLLRGMIFPFGGWTCTTKGKAEWFSQAFGFTAAFIMLVHLLLFSAFTFPMYYKYDWSKPSYSISDQELRIDIENLFRIFAPFLPILTIDQSENLLVFDESSLRLQHELLSGSEESFGEWFAEHGVGLDLRALNLRYAQLINLDLRKARLGRADLFGANLRLTNLQSADLGDANLQGADLRRANLQGADLRRANLQGADLRRANLQGADLKWANLQDADLGDANLQGADLRRANLQGARLWRANLQGADLKDAELQGADLKDAELQGADLKDAELQGADLEDANLQGAYLENAKLQGADLKDAELQGADLEDANLQGAYLENAKLQGADLKDAELQGADLEDANLQGAYLENAKLQGADLRWAELQGAYLSAAELQGADLDDANLQGADLQVANLQGVGLEDAELQGAYLRGAELRGADLRSAKLPGADLTDAIIQDVFTDKDTQWIGEDDTDWQGLRQLADTIEFSSNPIIAADEMKQKYLERLNEAETRVVKGRQEIPKLEPVSVERLIETLTKTLCNMESEPRKYTLEGVIRNYKVSPAEETTSIYNHFKALEGALDC